MTTENPAELSSEALTAEWDKAAKAALAAREYAKTVGAEVERRQVADEAAARLAGLAPAERAALAQALSVEGIKSGEGFNE
jgi:hypothetical protein